MTPARTQALISSLALLALSSPTSSAQIDASTFPSDQTRQLGEEHLLPLSGTYSQPSCGDQTRDRYEDAVGMIGDQPVFLFGPGLYHSVVDIPAKGNAVTLAPALISAPYPAYHAMLVSERGLERWWHDEETDEWLHDRLGSSLWQGAVAVEWNADPDAGKPMLLGLARDKRTFIVLHVTFGRSFEHSLTIDQPVEAFTTLDWAGSGTLEIAAVTSGHLRIFALNGQEIPAPDIGKIQALCRLREKGAAKDLLAVLQSPQKGGALRVVTPAGVTDPAPLGVFGATGMNAADLDLDDREDLMLARPSGEVLILRNRGPAQGFFALEPGDFTIIDPSPGQKAWSNGPAPAAADLDGDGDRDLLIPDPVTRSVWFYRNTRIDHTLRAPAVLGGAYSYDESTSQGVATLATFVPPNALSGADGLELVVWRQVDPEIPTEKTALAYAVLDTPPGQSVPVQMAVIDPLGSPALQSLEMRAVRRNPKGDVIEAGPSFVYTFGTSQASLLATAQIHGVDPADIIELTLTGGGAPGASPDIGAGLVPLGCVPCFADGDFPDRRP